MFATTGFYRNNNPIWQYALKWRKNNSQRDQSIPTLFIFVKLFAYREIAYAILFLQKQVRNFSLLKYRLSSQR